MPTTFIAVQCFQCSTMQVKQEKKSGNKWSCVVCGEKQSMRKVFAQGFMAKDVRGFVRKFNMSRLLQEEKTLSDCPSNEDKNDRKRRTDWTKYVDDDSEDCSVKLDVEHGDIELEPMVVTEMPKTMFKKLKLKASYVSGSKFPTQLHADSQFTEFQKTTRKGASRRSDLTVKNQEAYSDEKHIELHRAHRALKWNVLRAQIQQGNNDSSGNKEPWPSQSTKVAGSQFPSGGIYATRDENNHQEGCIRLLQQKDLLQSGAVSLLKTTMMNCRLEGKKAQVIVTCILMHWSP